MSKLIGLVLVAAGFGFAFEMFPLSTFDSAAPPAAIARPAVSSVAPAAPLTTASLPVSVTREPRMFAPGQPLHVRATSPAAFPATTVTADAPALSREQQSPADLARALQAELRRVGCYAGEVDGDWGPGSRRAMQSFTDRVNSTLPTDTPDLVLLSLVRGHGEQTCSAECAAGQIMSSRGQCVRASPTITASGPTGTWEPVVRVASRPVAAPARTRTATPLAPNTLPVAATPMAVASSTPAIPVVSVDPANRQIDWGTRMSIGAPASPLAGTSDTLSPPANPATTVALPPPATATPIARAPDRVERRRPTAASTYVNRPSYIARPRPRSNWKRDVFVSRN